MSRQDRPQPLQADEDFESPIVRTRSGLVRGRWRGGSAAFLGIPFAAPPVGPARFAAPHPPHPWDGVREATVYGATPQRRPFGDLTTIPEPSIPGEDTLNVNVFTPTPDTGAHLPVFVWIHGGGFFAGSPASPWYDGAAFNRDGIVTVTVSYRLGFDGFGWMQDAPLNRGILDQIAALEWVRDNITAFGGDPHQVTIGGQSAGGSSVLALLTAPPARGLFHRAISQSGVFSRTTPADAERAGRAMADTVGVPPTAAAWRRVPEDTILDHERAVNGMAALTGAGQDPQALVAGLAGGAGGDIGLVFSPVIDGDIIPEDPLTCVRSGRAAAVPLLAGTTRNEFAFPQPGGPAPEVYVDALRAAGLDPAATAPFEAEIQHIGSDYAHGQLVSTGLFRRPLVDLATARAQAGLASCTWLYDFAFHTPATGLAAHCTELPFTWGLLNAPGVTEALGGPLPEHLAHAAHHAWAAFITGHDAPWPTTDHNPTGAMVYDTDNEYQAHAYAFEAQLADLA